MGTKKKILVIDDDRDLCNTVKKAFSPTEFSIVYAQSVASGFQYLTDHHPHVILYHTKANIKDRAKFLKTLRASSLWSHIPVIFITDRANKEDFSNEWSSNDDHVIVKSNDPGDIIASVRSIMQNYSMTGTQPADDFELLFQLSPIGIIVFNDFAIVRANKSFLKALNWKITESLELKFANIFEKSSLVKIKNWMNFAAKEKTFSFNELVKIKDKKGKEIEKDLVISSFRKTGDHCQYIGFLSPASQGRDQLASEVCKMLKRENVNLTDAHEKMIMDILKSGQNNNYSHRHSFFTRRENEVLRLSMEGCSIKIIADKLSISTRTVEKYRTKLMEKSGGKNIAEVIVFALKNDLIRI